MGYRRPSGPPGARNHLVVVSAMDNANPLVRRIGKLLREAVIVNTTFGRNLFGDDERQHYRVMGPHGGPPERGGGHRREPGTQKRAGRGRRGGGGVPLDAHRDPHHPRDGRYASDGGARSGNRPEIVSTLKRRKTQAV